MLLIILVEPLKIRLVVYIHRIIGTHSLTFSVNVSTVGRVCSTESNNKQHTIVATAQLLIVHCLFALVLNVALLFSDSQT